MDKREWIVELISRYLAAARTLSRRLSESYGQADLLSGRRSKVIPRTGTSPDGIEFRFHGIGCWISDGAVLVDLDFTPAGDVDGFDAWRLHVFSEENPSLSEPRSLREVEDALKELIERGAIQAIDNSSLFRVIELLPK